MLDDFDSSFKAARNGALVTFALSGIFGLLPQSLQDALPCLLQHGGKKQVWRVTAVHPGQEHCMIGRGSRQPLPQTLRAPAMGQREQLIF